MVDFIEELKKVRAYNTFIPFYPERIKGYTDAEIAQIERDCNIHIHGQFRQLLRQMGRCSGGLIWGWDICMYKYSWQYEDFIEYQNSVLIDIYTEDEVRNIWEQANSHPIENKIFLWKASNEYMHAHYLFTSEPDDYLWEQDDSKNEIFITKTDFTLLDDLRTEMEYITSHDSFDEFELQNPHIQQEILARTKENFEYYTIGRLLP